MAYSKELIDHYENPRNVGSFEKGDESVGTGLVGAPACGDVMKLQIKVSEAGVIEDAKFKTFGAAAPRSPPPRWRPSFMKGKTLDEAGEIKNGVIAEALALPPVKIPLLDPRRGRDQGGHRRLSRAQGPEAGRSGGVSFAVRRGRRVGSKRRIRGMARPMPQAMEVTDAAAERVKALLDQRGKPSAGIRIGVRTKGCSGLSYTLEYADEKGQFDEVVETKGVNILIDPKAVMFIIGTEMDYVEEKLESGFVFRNPNERGRCGCGESFHV